MFESIIKDRKTAQLTFSFEGADIPAVPGMSVAAALLAHGTTAFRQTPTSGSDRGPFCMMGACYDCMVIIDGVVVQACMAAVKEQMIVSKHVVQPMDDKT